MRSQHQRGFHPRPTRARRRFESCPSPLFLLLIVFVLFNFCTRVYAGKDYYDILGVSRDADVATIKRAFRKLAVKYHPDKNPGDKEAEQKYVELNNAYEVLGDDSKRQKYDMFGEDGLRNGENDDMDNDFNPFGDFFGRRRRRRQERRVQDVVVPLSVSLEMLYNGGVIEAAHKKRVICSSWSDCERKCSRCGGQGVVIQTRRLGPGFVQQIQTACPVCSGTGKISNPNCKSCPNGQFEQIEKQLLIDVESGMADGQMITFEGETDEIPDYHTGNVRFEIDTQLHDRFERKGDNLHYKLTITLSEALVGVNRIVRQLDGRQVAIKTDSVITPGDNIVIKGEGMPVYDTVEAGDMIVDFWVKFPESLSDEQKEAAIALHGEIPTLKETGDGVRNSSSHTNEEKTEL